MHRMLHVLFYLFICTLFWAKGMYSLDPDFGFHLRMGQIIVQQGIPTHDIFSYTMPSFPDIDEAWLLDVSIAYLYPRIGMSGLAVIFAVITLSALWIVQGIVGSSRSVHRGVSNISLLLCSAVLLLFSGIRPQVISWFFLAVVLRILIDPRWKTYGRFALPLVFSLWSNLHGGFVAGLVTVGVVTFVRFVSSFWQAKRVQNRYDSLCDPGQARMTGKYSYFIDLIVFFLCILATSVNPYGWRIYDDVGVVVTSSTARWTIAEWLPTILSPDLSMGMLFAFSLFFVWQYRRAVDHRLLILYYGYFLAAMSSLRYIPIWILAAHPATVSALQRMWETVRSNPWGKRQFIRSERIMLVASLVFVAAQGILIIGRSGSSYWRGAYPSEAVRYVRRFPSDGRLFSDYGWGGYLIWQLPEKKTFVDGRMALWEQSPKPGETSNAFAHYMAIISQRQPIQRAIDTYGIDTVLLPVEKGETAASLRDIALAIRRRFIANTPSLGGLPSVGEQLLQSGWRVVYQDQVALVLRK